MQHYQLVACVMLPWKIFTSAMVYRSYRSGNASIAEQRGRNVGSCTDYPLWTAAVSLSSGKAVHYFAMNPLTGSRTSMIFALKLRSYAWDRYYQPK